MLSKDATLATNQIVKDQRATFVLRQAQDRSPTRSQSTEPYTLSDDDSSANGQRLRRQMHPSWISDALPASGHSRWRGPPMSRVLQAPSEESRNITARRDRVNYRARLILRLAGCRTRAILADFLYLMRLVRSCENGLFRLVSRIGFDPTARAGRHKAAENAHWR